MTSNLKLRITGTYIWLLFIPYHISIKYKIDFGILFILQILYE